MVAVTEQRLAQMPFPVICLDKHGRHFIVAGLRDEKALILESGSPAPKVCSPAEVMTRSEGKMMLVASRASLAGDFARFDFSWFVPAVVKYRRLLLEVVFVSGALQVFGLVSPLMFQVVMDKVLVNRAFSTLNVVLCSTPCDLLVRDLADRVEETTFLRTRRIESMSS